MSLLLNRGRRLLWGYTNMDFMTGMVGATNDLLDQREKTRLELMLKKQAIQEQMNANIQQEQSKYNTEQVVPKALGEWMGSRMGSPAPENLQQMNILAGMDRAETAATNQKKANELVANEPQYDNNGLKIADNILNQNGITVRRLPNPAYRTNLERYKVLIGSLDRMNSLSNTYNQLGKMVGPYAGKAANALGTIGLNKAAETLKKETAEAMPLITQGLSKVPGSRYAQSLNAAMSKGFFDATTQKEVKNNILDNAQFQHYLELKQIGGIVPDYLESKFANVPKQDNGVPLNVAFYKGKMYLPEDIDKASSEFSGTEEMDKKKAKDEFLKALNSLEPTR